MSKSADSADALAAVSVGTAGACSCVLQSRLQQVWWRLSHSGDAHYNFGHWTSVWGGAGAGGRGARPQMEVRAVGDDSGGVRGRGIDAGGDITPAPPPTSKAQSYNGHLPNAKASTTLVGACSEAHRSRHRPTDTAASASVLSALLLVAVQLFKAREWSLT